jgi:hypothetical protein
METGRLKLEKDAGADGHRAHRGKLRRVLWTALGLLAWAVLLFNPLRACAEADDESEYRVKLAFLYNFAQFVEWPADAFRDPAAPLTICVAGQDPFEGEIGQGLRGRTAGGHLVEIRKLKRDENPRGCHMIFVRAGDRKLAGRLLADLRGSSTLTVGETKGFADLGGVINLVVEENKLRFEINLGAARQTRLKLSSKLLALAKIVDAAP